MMMAVVWREKKWYKKGRRCRLFRVDRSKFLNNKCTRGKKRPHSYILEKKNQERDGNSDAKQLHFIRNVFLLCVRTKYFKN